MLLEFMLINIVNLFIKLFMLGKVKEVIVFMVKRVKIVGIILLMLFIWVKERVWVWLQVILVRKKSIVVIKLWESICNMVLLMFKLVKEVILRSIKFMWEMEEQVKWCFMLFWVKEEKLLQIMLIILRMIKIGVK